MCVLECHVKGLGPMLHDVNVVFVRVLSFKRVSLKVFFSHHLAIMNKISDGAKAATFLCIFILNILSISSWVTHQSTVVIILCLSILTHRSQGLTLSHCTLWYKIDNPLIKNSKS